MGDANGVLVALQYSGFDHQLQLTHVALPMMCLQTFEDFLIKPLDRPSVTLRVVLQKRSGERQNVFVALAQGRHLDDVIFE